MSLSDVPLVSLRQIEKRFGGVPALQGVNFDVRAGEAHVLLGENGAGKSTLLKILTGVHQPDGGVMEWQGTPFTLNAPAEAARRGIRMVYQELPLAPHLTVAESILLGQEPTRAGLLNRDAERQEAEAVLRRFNLAVSPQARVGELGPAGRQIVEIARALHGDARLLLLDEPTASLGEREIADLFQVLRDLKSRGLGIVYVSHRLPECFAIGDRVTVLRDGRNVYQSALADTDAPTVVRQMVGRDVAHLYPRTAPALGAVRLDVRNLTVSPRLQNVSLQVRAGEIVGLAGLMGSGRTSLLSALWGLRPATGTVTLDGKSLPLVRGPKAAIHAGMGFVSEDRKRLGLALDLPLTHNLTLANLRRVTSGPWLSPRRDRQAAQMLIQAGGIKAASPDITSGSLSGGNQQKVVMARWQWAETSVWLLDEPTRGVDVGAKAELYARINEATQSGACALLVSSELPELLGMSDRILVLHGGAVVADLPRAKATQERVLHLAMTGEDVPDAPQLVEEPHL